MLIVLMFWVLMIAAAGVIIVNGTSTARLFLCLILIATLATAVVRLTLDKSLVAYGYLMIDATLLLAVLLLVLRLNVSWPIWFAGFQTITVGSEIGRIILPGLVASLYGDLAGFWAAPAMVFMAIGVTLDKRSRNEANQNLGQPSLGT